jgi:hypothetical protein
LHRSKILLRAVCKSVALQVGAGVSEFVALQRGQSSASTPFEATFGAGVENKDNTAGALGLPYLGIRIARLVLDERQAPEALGEEDAAVKSAYAFLCLHVSAEP